MSSLTYITEISKNSLLSLAENKRRTLLTTLGIIIGVSSVIVIMAIGLSAQGLILAQVNKLGSNLIGIMPGKSEDKGPPATVFGIVITTLTYEDALAIKQANNVPHVVDVSANVRGSEVVTWQANQLTADVFGTNVGYLPVEGGQVAEGRFFTDDEDKSVSRVAVLGSAVKNDLFDGNNPIGRKIKIGTQTFEVIGVMEQRGKVAFQDYDNYIFIPLNTMQKLIAGVRHLGFIRVKIDKQENVAEAIADIGATLRERHGIKDMSGANDDFTVRAAAEALDALTTVTNSLRFFLAAMAALSLVVGGIGIMNIMLIRVAQRTREIGLRKAIGATNSDIVTQFLVESISITLLGGLIGIGFGEFLAWLIAQVAQALGYDWQFIVSPWSIVLAVGVSMAIGLIFGLYPARKAGRLNPIEALRYE
ncbi:MAG: ABC transporter permease [Candidatus Falkowbacteria bacterium]